ncbi:MAG: hypothetical protein Q7S27_05365 [Nanoarchaeota archaeon]|nr:hypothetical protein [Nanoarchaeota archaeon]
MRTLFTILVASLLVLSAVPAVLAVSTSVSTGLDIDVEEFAPLVDLCGSRIVTDDNVEPWRVSDGGQYLVERINNYAFEGEKISWLVLVMDKNKIDQNIDVYATIGDSQGEGNEIEANCLRADYQSSVAKQNFDSCNAEILEEELEFNPDTMAFFECTLTVETPASMYGEYWVTVEAQDGSGLMGTMDENEFWFFNPVIALSIDGELSFDNVRPGSSSYSDTLLIGNDADAGSGVLLDMFISGTDFYDSSSSGARCPDTNQLALTNFRYFITSGAYSSFDDPRSASDPEGESYVAINYGNSFGNVGTNNPFYGTHEILQAGGPFVVGGPFGSAGYKANILVPGAEHALTFRLDLPEPCNGDFDTGSIYFWGEAI